MADFESKITELMTASAIVDKTENSDYYYILVEAIKSHPYGYAMYSDAIAKFLRTGTEIYPNPQNQFLIQFLTSLHLHGVPLEERRKITLKEIKKHWDRTNPKG